MTTRSLVLVTAAALWLGASACDRASVRSVLYYSFALLEESADADHYQTFVQRGDGVVSLGCFVVQRRQVNCFDSGGNGTPNLRPAVVECTCPCTEVVADPCDATRPEVRAGVVRGLVDQSDGPIILGGVEIPTSIDVSDASELFITREPNQDPSPLPSADVVLDGTLRRDGDVLRALLLCPGTDPVQGDVTVVPVDDEVLL
jgi:hypothetical protein